MRSRLTGDRGQGTVEHTGLVLLLAVVLGGALLAWPAGATEVPAKVTDAISRALCKVRGGSCDLGPCVVAGDERRTDVDLTLHVVHFGSGWSGLVERLSDGTFVVTRVRTSELGLDAGVKLGSSEAMARAMLAKGDLLSWSLPDRASADRLLAALGSDRWASISGSGILQGIVDGRSSLPEPDVRGTEGRVVVGLDGQLGPVSLEVEEGGAVGVRRRRDGSRVLYLKAEGRVGAALGIAEAGGDTEVVLGLELDRQGRAVDLSVVQGGAFRGSADLPPIASEVAGVLDVPSSGERRVEVERHLDLTVPAHAEAARGVLAALQRGRPDAAVGPALHLGRLLRERATVDARTYGVERDASTLVDSGFKAGAVGVAGKVTTERTRSRLLAARSRGSDGRWVARDDCLAAV